MRTRKQPARPAVPPHAGGGAVGEGKPDQLTICTKHCGARCCRYITVTVAAPKSEPDWDEVRWWLAHEGVMVTHDHEGWMLHLQTRCKNLRADNACGVYPDHMLACKEYDPSDCEYTGEVPFDVKLESEEDLAAYLERRRLKRGKAVAVSIRKASQRRKAALRSGGLVTLAPLAAPKP
jgi:Fe-S-cluster containining protein